MGKSEKLVVLSVLLIVVVLFVWSLQGGGSQAAETDGGTNYGDTPVEDTTSRRAPEGAGDDGDDPAGDDAEEEDDPTEPNAADLGDSEVADAGEPAEEMGPPLLFASVGNGASLTDRRATAGEAERLGPIRMQPGWDLVTTSGLERTVDPKMFLYEPVSGSTWASIARDLYGDEAKAALLRHNNEGMETPNRKIMVPAEDDLEGAASVRIVEVLEGENLWQVATRTLDKGSRWKEIFEANRDVISDPDFISPGTRLRIPVD